MVANATTFEIGQRLARLTETPEALTMGREFEQQLCALIFSSKTTTSTPNVILQHLETIKAGLTLLVENYKDVSTQERPTEESQINAAYVFFFANMHKVFLNLLEHDVKGATESLNALIEKIQLENQQAVGLNYDLEIFKPTTTNISRVLITQLRTTNPSEDLLLIEKKWNEFYDLLSARALKTS